MKRSVAALLLAAAALPYAAKIPYILRAWGCSPLDAFDAWLVPFALVALVRAGCLAVRGRPDLRVAWSGIPALVAGAAGYAAGLLFAVNALQILSGVVFLGGAWWLLFGVGAVRVAVPAFAVLALMTTSTTYWAVSFSGESVVTVRAAKMTIAVMALWMLFRTKSVSPPSGPTGPSRAVLWLAALLVPAAAGVFFWMRSGDLSHAADPFRPVFRSGCEAGWIGREQEPEPWFRSFFGSSDAHRFSYFTPSNAVGVLAVKCGTNVHEIHPATHCLRTSGWRVEAERAVDVPLGDGRTLAVSEADISRGGRKCLAWVWYSNDRLSTGSFFLFRSRVREGGWHTYQLRTPLGPGGGAAARALLTAFLAGRGETDAEGESHR